MSMEAVEALRLLEQVLTQRDLSSSQRQELQPVIELLADRLVRQTAAGAVS